MNEFVGYNRSALGKLKIVIGVDDGITSVDNIIDLVSIGKITIGENSEKEFTFFPNRLTLKLLLRDDEAALIALSYKLFTYPVKVSIYKDKLNNDTYSTPVIICDLDKQSLKVDIIEKTIELTAVDEINGLKSIDPRDNPLSFNLSHYYRSVYAIEEIMKLVNINQVKIMSDLEGRIDDSGSIHYIPFSDWYFSASLYFGPNALFEDLFSMLRNIMLNYSLAAYINLEREFVALSLINSAPTIININIRDIIGDYKYIIKDNCNKATLYLNNSSYVFQETILQVPALAEEIAEEIKIVQTCGWEVDFQWAWSGVYANYGGILFVVDPYSSGGLKSGPVRAKIDSSQYSYDKNLWEFPLLVLTGKLNERLGGLKYEAELTVRGLEYSIANHYQIPFFQNYIFRCVKIDYDLIKGQSKLYLRSAFSPSDLLTPDPAAIPGELPVENPPEKFA